MRDINPDTVAKNLQEILDKSENYQMFIHNLNTYGDVVAMTKVMLKLKYKSFKEYFKANKGYL